MKQRRSKAQGMPLAISRPRLGLLSYLTVLGLAVRPDFQTAGDLWLASLLGVFSVDPALHLLLFAGLCFFYFHALRYIQTVSWDKRDRVCTMIPAALFAAFMVLGRSFADTASWDLVFGNGLQLVKSLVAWNGYFILFSVAIALLYTRLSAAEFWRGKEARQFNPGLWGRYLRALSERPFRTAFFTLLIVYLPYMVLSYPGISMGDTPTIITQGFNIPESTSNMLNLIDENVRLNGHHPVVYTVLLHACLVVGNTVFGSYNVGLFLAAFVQALVQFAVMATLIAQLVRLGLRTRWAAGVLAYFIIAPRTQNYTFLLTKDVLAFCALALFLLGVFRILAQEGPQRQNALMCTLSGIGLCLLRNEGRYVVLATVAIAMLLSPKRRRQLAASGALTLLAVLLFFHALMPALHITSGSKREMLSVPFQQTARYVRDHPDEITPEEKAAISAVLAYDTLAERYQPELSDPVKATFRESATGADLTAYFKVWLQMGAKHPDVYLQATMNNYYNYFYPGKTTATLYSYNWSTHCMELTGQMVEEGGLMLTLHHPEGLETPRQTYETLRETAFGLPLFSLLKSSAIYVWALMLLVFYHVKNRGKEVLVLLAPLVLLVCVCLLGPVNGNYFRYLYGVSVTLPVVFFLSLYLEKPKNEKE